MKRNQETYKAFKKPSWWKRNTIEIWITIGGLILIGLVFLAKVYRETDTLNIEGAAQLGDFVGGFIGTIFTLISVLLLYSTLKEQRMASTVEKFETKYFELIKIHRENVNEMGLRDYSGKKIFVILIREFREILKISIKTAKDCNQILEPKDFFIVSYHALFFGVGPNSSRMFKSSLSNYNKEFIEKFESTLNNKETKKQIKEARNFNYTPFEGHQSRLGHYYRHLYQTVCYVDNQTSDINKYEYVKTLRAQLTTHEQALLFINCLTIIGEVWWDKRLLINYRFVQNIPYHFFDKENEIDIEIFFPKIYFEWQENNLKTRNKVLTS